MSFFHILPSNAAPDTFPHNHASAFSTPVGNPYTLSGKWEVALMNITYSGCVNTFHNDEIIVEKTFNIEKELKKLDRPIRVNFAPNKNVETIVQNINEKMKGILKVSLSKDKDKRFATWRVVNPKVCIVISHSLRGPFSLHQDVFSSWDLHPGNYFGFDASKWEEINFDILVVPLNYNNRRVYIKKKGETITLETFISRFNEQLQGILDLSLDNAHLVLRKLKNDNMLALCSPDFHAVNGFRHAGIYEKGFARYFSHEFERTNKNSDYYIDILHLQTIIGDSKMPCSTISLPPRSFNQHEDAVRYLNERMSDPHVTFSLHKSSVLQVNIADEETSVIFSNTLRDIFAFDENKYSGKGTFKASDTFSLSRRIHYLYIYSNIGDYVRIGNTKAPLLAVIPFTSETCNELLLEKTYKTPMYVPVIKEHISQIDMFIYDGAGELVPFSSDAVTSLRLHFNQV